jgi:Mg2+/Co2+ transporter CorB
MQFYIDAALLALMLALSAFFAASEVAFLSITRVKLHSVMERKLPGSESLYRLRSNRRRIIITLLICNNIVNIAASAIATSMAIGLFGEDGVGIAIGVMTFLLLTFGDITPKSIASTYGEKIILTFSPIIELLYYLTYPLMVFFEQINRLIPGVYSRATGIEQFTEEELRTAVKLGAKDKSISEKEKSLIENVLEFNDRPVTKAMTPRSSVTVLHAEMLVAAAHKKALDSNFSRFPVIDRHGKVIGTVSVKILGRALYEHPEWAVGQLAWKPIRIKSSETASGAFEMLQILGRNIAVVEDERGRFLGVVTLEDLLEELVGELK